MSSAPSPAPSLIASPPNSSWSLPAPPSTAALPPVKRSRPGAEVGAGARSVGGDRDGVVPGAGVELVGEAGRDPAGGSGRRDLHAGRLGGDPAGVGHDVVRNVVARVDVALQPNRVAHRIAGVGPQGAGPGSDGVASEEIRQPSSVRSSSTVSDDGAWPCADVFTCAVAVLPSTLTSPTIRRGS